MESSRIKVNTKHTLARLQEHDSSNTHSSTAHTVLHSTTSSSGGVSRSGSLSSRSGGGLNLLRQVQSVGLSVNDRLGKLVLHRQPAQVGADLGGVHEQSGLSSVGFVWTVDDVLRSDNCVLTIGVGLLHSSSPVVVCKGEGGGVGSVSRQGGFLTSVQVSSGLGVGSVVVGEGHGDGERGVVRHDARRSSSSK